MVVFIVLKCDAQIIDADRNPYSKEPFFNPEFILSENIKSITGAFHYKRDNEKMYDKGIIVKYEFDCNGRLERLYNTFKKYGGETDTLFVFYEYDSIGRLNVKRTTDNFGFYSINYSYNESGNIFQETYSRELNANSYSGQFILSKQYAMGVEKFEFTYVSPVYYTKKLLNSLGLPFKEISYLMNENGKLIEETGTFLSIRHVERKKYIYNDNGKLSESNESSDLGQNSTIHYIYAYDQKDQLIEIKKLKNEEPVKVTEFMLNEKGFLTNALSRDIAGKIIDVTKFSYEFY